MSNKYNLKWNSHHAETLQSFENLRHREMFVDVTLSCNGQFLKAHKLVLCAGSGYFERVLNKDGLGTPTVHFYGVDMHLLKLLVEFMYCGEVEVPDVDLEKFIEVAENLEVKGLKGDKAKSSTSHGVVGTTIPVSDVQDALAHKRKSTGHSWLGLGEMQHSPAKMARSRALVPRARSQMATSHLQQSEAVASPSQVLQSQSEPSMSTSTDEIVIKDETKEEELDDIHDVMDSGSVATEEGQWDEQASYSVEGMEGEPEMPMNIPPEVDPQTMCRIQRYVWCGQISSFNRRIHFCGLCPYENYNKSKVVRHSRTHTNERPYQCPKCGRKFAQSQNLQYHLVSKICLQSS